MTSPVPPSDPQPEPGQQPEAGAQQPGAARQPDAGRQPEAGAQQPYGAQQPGAAQQPYGAQQPGAAQQPYGGQQPYGAEPSSGGPSYPGPSYPGPSYPGPSYPGASAPAAGGSRRTLAIVGLVAAIIPCTGLIGLVISIVALVRGRRDADGATRVMAWIGVAVGALWTIAGIVLLVVFGNIFATCADLGPGVHQRGGVTYTCDY